MIIEILLVLMACSPLIIILLVLWEAEREREKGMQKYIDNNKCIKCGEKKSAEYMIMQLNSFHVYCGNEKCENFGRKILIDLDDALGEQNEQ